MFECQFENLERLLQLYFWFRKEIQLHFKNRFKVSLKYTYLLNSWCTQYILEIYKSKLFSIIFIKLQILQVKISPRVYLKYTWYLSTEAYLKYSTILAGQNTNINFCSRNLWGHGLVVRMQVYQTKGSKQ